MRALLRVIEQTSTDDDERLTIELDDALDWLVDCQPQPDANQRKSGWPWVVEQAQAYVARRKAQSWKVPCGEGKMNQPAEQRLVAIATIAVAKLNGG